MRSGELVKPSMSRSRISQPPGTRASRFAMPEDRGEIGSPHSVHRMRRRNFTIGVLLAAGAGAVRAQEPPKQHRIAIVISAGPVVRINDPESRYWQAFWDELRRLGDVEGQNLTVERYSGEGRPEGFAELLQELGDRFIGWGGGEKWLIGTQKAL